jgi:putative SOS response-associated peptidase YedK
MCGRFTQERSDRELAEIFEAEPLTDDPGGRFNIAPTDPATVVVQREERRALTTYRWGLVPHWATDASGAARLINARAETVASSSTFRDSLLRRRCLVPADGFYEWQRLERRRQPYFIHPPDGRAIAFAGLWSGWHDPETNEVRRTFTIITTAANDRIAALHDRMPVILPHDAWASWLDPRPADIGELMALLRPAPDDDLELVPVVPLVNNVRNQGPALIRRLEDQVDEGVGAPEATLGL